MGSRAFFLHGCKCCVLKQNTCGNPLEVTDCTLDSPNVLYPKCFAGLRCPLVLDSSKDAIFRERHREMVEESGKGVPLED